MLRKHIFPLLLKLDHQLFIIQEFTQVKINREESFFITCIETPSTLAMQATLSRKVTVTGTAMKNPFKKALIYLLPKPCICAIIWKIGGGEEIIVKTRFQNIGTGKKFKRRLTWFYWAMMRKTNPDTWAHTRAWVGKANRGTGAWVRQIMRGRAGRVVSLGPG